MVTLPQITGALRRSRTSTVARNVVSNYATVVWMSGLSFAFVPIYVRNLGPVEWGVVAACVTLQGFLALLDVGLGQIMPRSFARVAGNAREEAALFRAYSRIYTVLALSGFVAGELCAGPAAQYWFRSPGIDSGHLRMALHLIPVQFLFQFANNAHLGLWYGLQLQRKANLRTCVFGTARQLAALSSVLLYSRTAFVYLVPFVLVSGIEWASNRHALLASYRGTDDGGQSADVRAILRDTGPFAVAVIAGLLLSQADRFVLSATQDLTQYGYYVIVANVGLAFTSLHTPLMRAYFPRIARDDALGHQGRATSFGMLFWAVLLLCVLPLLIVIIYAPALLFLWLRNPAIARAGTLPFRLILASVAVNSIYNVIYQRLLSRDAGRTVIAINVAGLVAVSITALVVGHRIGIALGGLMWLVGSVTQLALGLLWLRYRARAALKVA